MKEAEIRNKQMWEERQAELNKASLEHSERQKVQAAKAQIAVAEEAATRKKRFEEKVKESEVLVEAQRKLVEVRDRCSSSSSSSC